MNILINCYEKNQLILLLFIPQIIYAKSYFASDVFFNKYQKLNENQKRDFTLNIILLMILKNSTYIKK